MHTLYTTNDIITIKTEQIIIINISLSKHISYVLIFSTNI